MSFDSNANFSCLLFVGASFWMHSFPKCFSLHYFYYIVLRMLVFPNIVQCPLDIPTLDKAAALPIAAATRVTDLRQYINSNLAYNGLKFFVLCIN